MLHLGAVKDPAESRKCEEGIELRTRGAITVLIYGGSLSACGGHLFPD